MREAEKTKKYIYHNNYKNYKNEKSFSDWWSRLYRLSPL